MRPSIATEFSHVNRIDSAPCLAHTKCSRNISYNNIRKMHSISYTSHLWLSLYVCLVLSFSNSMCVYYVCVLEMSSRNVNTLYVYIYVYTLCAALLLFMPHTIFFFGLFASFLCLKFWMTCNFAWNWFHHKSASKNPKIAHPRAHAIRYLITSVFLCVFHFSLHLQ